MTKNLGYFLRASDTIGRGPMYRTRSEATAQARAINRLNPGLPTIKIFAESLA